MAAGASLEIEPTVLHVAIRAGCYGKYHDKPRYVRQDFYSAIFALMKRFLL